MPENTLEAFQKSADMGVDILEMDIRMTKDGHLVVIHDKTIDRTTNGSGLVKEMTLAEIQSYDAAYYFSTDKKFNNVKNKQDYIGISNEKAVFPLRDSGVKIPTLKQIFLRFPQKRMIIEMKQKTPSIVKPFCKLIQKSKKENHVLAASFDQDTLEEFRQLCPEVTTSAGAKETFQFFLLQKLSLSSVLSPTATALQVPEALNFSFAGFSINIQVISDDFMESAHNKNMVVHVWTVNEEEQMKRLIFQRVDGIMTDYPDRLKSLMNSM